MSSCPFRNTNHVANLSIILPGRVGHSPQRPCGRPSKPDVSVDQRDSTGASHAYYNPTRAGDQPASQSGLLQGSFDLLAPCAPGISVTGGLFFFLIGANSKFIIVLPIQPITPPGQRSFLSSAFIPPAPSLCSGPSPGQRSFFSRRH